MVAPVARAWIRQDGDPRPLQARWEDASAQLAKLGGSPVVPASEIGIQEMQASIRRIEGERRAAAEPFDERRRAARAAFRDACWNFRHVHTATAECQQRLRRYANDPIYRLLFDMPEVLREPTPPQSLLDAQYGGQQESADLYHLRIPRLDTVEAYRQATAWVNDRTFELQRQHDAVIAVSQFGSEEIGSRTDRLVTALLRHIERIERRQTTSIAALSQRLDEIAGQIERVSASARYVRKHRKGSK
jgi:hypothetical protein